MESGEAGREKLAPPRPAPMMVAGRLEMMDALRGFALLGILTMNIRAFGLLEPAYLNPFYAGALDPVNLTAFWFGQLFFHFKFLSLFSLLFGAGLALQWMSRRADPEGARRLHLRRMVWLLLFGLLHGALLFSGDILAIYALTGLVLFGLRSRPPRTLLIWALALMLAMTVLTALVYGAMHLMPAEEFAKLKAEWRPDTERALEIMSGYTTDWVGQIDHRVEFFSMALLAGWPLFGLWKAGSMMLIGMALFKLTVLGGRLPRRVYAIMAAAGLALGLIIEAGNTAYQMRIGYDLRFAQTLGLTVSAWSSLFMALGYVGLFYLIMPAQALSGVRKRLAQVGQLAFSNYILTSVIASWIFNGHGLGLYNQLSYTQLIPIVFGIWAVILAWSPLWLRFHQRGPLEALWRWLSYPRQGRTRPANPTA